MSKTVWASAGTLVLVLAVVGMLTSSGDKPFTVTSFGKLPVGYGALFDLLSELGLPVARSYAAGSDLPRAATLWWVRPAGVCTAATGADAPAAGAAGPDRAAGDDGTFDAGAWIEDGGTAVVFLPPLGPNAACASIAGIVVPPRTPRDAERDADAQDDVRAAGRSHRRMRQGAAGALQLQTVEGPLVPSPRQLRGPGFSAFDSSGEWQVRARLDGQPFVLEHALGRGRLVVVADARVFSNAWLATGDAAPLALDLARAYGVPRFDERAHGLRAEDSALRYLAASPAAFVFLGLALLGGVFAWRGSAWPARTLGDGSLGAPTLEAFVDSLAGLYARTHDYGRVLTRYREFSVARLRRHFGQPADTPAAVLIARVYEARRATPQALALLTRDAPVRSEAALHAAVHALDHLVEEVTR
jgi:hypothetical protein